MTSHLINTLPLAIIVVFKNVISVKCPLSMSLSFKLCPSELRNILFGNIVDPDQLAHWSQLIGI